MQLIWWQFILNKEKSKIIMAWWGVLSASRQYHKLCVSTWLQEAEQNSPKLVPSNSFTKGISLVGKHQWFHHFPIGFLSYVTKAEVEIPYDVKDTYWNHSSYLALERWTLTWFCLDEISGEWWPPRVGRRKEWKVSVNGELLGIIFQVQKMDILRGLMDHTAILCT